MNGWACITCSWTAASTSVMIWSSWNGFCTRGTAVGMQLQQQIHKGEETCRTSRFSTEKSGAWRKYSGPAGCYSVLSATGSSSLLEIGEYIKRLATFGPSDRLEESMQGEEASREPMQGEEASGELPARVAIR